MLKQIYFIHLYKCKKKLLILIIYQYESTDEKIKKNKTSVKDTPKSVDNSNQEELRKIDYNVTYEVILNKKSQKGLLKEEVTHKNPLNYRRRRRRIHYPSLRIFLKH